MDSVQLIVLKMILAVVLAATFWGFVFGVLVACNMAVDGIHWLSRWLKRCGLPIVVLATLLACSNASACSRCGRSVCAYQKQIIATPVVQQVVADTPDVYVINNQNVTGQPLVAGGATGYVSTGPQGLQAATIPFFNPDRYLSAKMELIKAAQQLGAVDAQQTSALVDKLATNQAQAVHALAVGQASAMVLNAANITGTQPAQSQQSAFVFKQDGGTFQIQPLTSAQVESLTLKAEVTAGTGGASPSATPVTPATPPTDKSAWNAKYLGDNLKFPNLNKFCNTCHGLDLSAPKGNLFIGDDDNVARAMRDKWFQITTAIGRDKSMPPASAPQPTQAEREAILNEIESIISQRSSP